MQIWFWFTPIVYVVAIVPGSLSQLMVYNPVYSFIKIWQSVFVYHSIPDLSGLMIITLIAHCLLIMAFLMYRVLEKDIRDFL
ncbi:MAG TPA: hypothetical protein EYQ43_07640 [Methyloprofundus sp.]|nr:hypothetical protein [Methyloprofundus sp.]